MRVRGLLLTTLLLLVAARPSAAQVLENGDFGAGLDGWTTTQRGGATTPGTVSVEGGAALLSEGDSFLVQLEQTFTPPREAVSLSFRLELTPGFDRTDSRIPDAFEVALMDAAGAPVLPVWKALAATSFNLQEDGTGHVAEGTTWTDGVVLFDLSNLTPGQPYSLRFVLVGGDGDYGTAVRIDDVTLELVNQPPTADAGIDRTVECAGSGGTTVVLDGSSSADPDGDDLAYTWRDADEALLGSTSQIEVTLAVGEHTFTLEVDDGNGATDAATVVITVEDGTPPSVSAFPDPETVAADGACDGVVPDLRDAVLATDICAGADGLVVVQEPAPGTSLVLDAETTVTFTVSDPSGNETQVQTTVTLEDTTPPSIDDGLAALTLQADATCSAAIPNLTEGLVVSDNCTPAASLDLSQDPPPASALGLGEWPVTVVATDGSGNATEGQTTATVEDATPPTIEALPSDRSIAVDGSCEGTLPDLRPDVVASDNCTSAEALTVAQSPAPATTLTLDAPLEVSFTVSDEAGNEASDGVTTVSLTDPGGICTGQGDAETAEPMPDVADAGPPPEIITPPQDVVSDTTGVDIPPPPDVVPEDVPIVPDVPEDVPIVPDVPEDVPIVPDVPDVAEDVPIVPDVAEDVPAPEDVPEDVPLVPDVPDVAEDVPVVPDVAEDVPAPEDVPATPDVAEDIPSPPDVGVDTGVKPDLVTGEDVPPGVDLPTPPEDLRGSTGSSGAKGCGCDITAPSRPFPSGPLFLVLLAALGWWLARRRRV